MPTYGYECTSCENQFETFQSVKDDPLTSCESCGGILRKRIYPVGIAFKGSGFYVNDYAPKSGSAAEAKVPEVKSETPASEAPKAEAAKTDAPKADAPKTETKTPAAAN